MCTDTETEKNHSERDGQPLGIQTETRGFAELELFVRLKGFGEQQARLC